MGQYKHSLEIEVLYKLTLGKQSLSKTKACKSCPVAKGINSQLPHHHGLFLNQPSPSRALYVNSTDLVAM